MNIKIKKITARIGAGLIILIALALAVRAVLNITTGKKLERVIEGMKAEGVPLMLKEIEPECDPSNNAAVSLKAAEAVYSLEEKEQRELIRDTIEDLFSRRQLDDQSKTELQNAISGQQVALRFLREAATKSCFKYEDNWDINPSSLKIPDLVKLIKMFRIYGVDCYLTAESGQVEKGLEKVFSGLDFLEIYLQEPFLINYLAAVANMKVLLVSLQRIAEDFPIDRALAVRIVDRLDPAPWRDELLLDFKAERIHAIEAAFNFLDGKHEYIEGRLFKKISIWLFKPYLKSGMAKILETYNEYDRAISLPYFESRDIWEQITQDIDKPFYKQIMDLLFPDFTVVRFKETTLEAMLQSIRLGLGCRIYKEETGSFPQSLADLSPRILDIVPHDPFTGKPFIYRIDDTGLIIYSIGNNLKDDQGRGTWMIDRLVMEKDDDWAWIDSFLR